MKKKIIMVVVTALIVAVCATIISVASYRAGYTVGYLDASHEKYEEVVGVYRCENWNGNETVVLVLNEDGTCILPTGVTGTWRQMVDEVLITFGANIEHATIAGDGVGIIFAEHFFEKIS